MRQLLVILLLIVAWTTATAQQGSVIPFPGRPIDTNLANRSMRVDSAMTVTSLRNSDTLRYISADGKGRFVFRRINLTSIDTSSLSARINQKLNISDSATIYATIKRVADSIAAVRLSEISYTDTLNRRIPTKKYTDSLIALQIKYADTSTLIRTIAASNTALAAKVNYTDTSLAWFATQRKVNTQLANYWLNTGAMTLGRTGIIGLADSNNLNIALNNKNYITITPRGIVTATAFNSDTSGNTRAFVISDTVRAGGSNGNIGLSVELTTVTAGASNTGMRLTNNGSQVFSVSSSGLIANSAGATIGGTVSAAQVNASSSGMVCTRNSAAAGVALTVNQQNTGGGGNVATFQAASATVSAVSVGGVITARGVGGIGSAPTIADSSGVAGVTVAISGSSTDYSGTITVTTGVNAITAASVFRLTFNQASTTAVQTVILQPVNDAAMNLGTSGIFPIAASYSTAGFTGRTRGTIAANTSYVYNYFISKAP